MKLPQGSDPIRFMQIIMSEYISFLPPYAQEEEKTFGRSWDRTQVRGRSIHYTTASRAGINPIKSVTRPILASLIVQFQRRGLGYGAMYSEKR